MKNRLALVLNSSFALPVLFGFSLDAARDMRAVKPAFLGGCSGSIVVIDGKGGWMRYWRCAGSRRAVRSESSRDRIHSTWTGLFHGHWICTGRIRKNMTMSNEA